MIFNSFFFFTKIAKKSDLLPASDDVESGPRRRADVARGTSAWMRRGTEATWQSHGWPTRGAGGADAWQESTRTGPRGARVGRRVGDRAGSGGPTGIVGPW